MKSTSDLFNEIIPLGRLIHMVNQKKDRLLNEYLSPLDITAAQFKAVSYTHLDVYKRQLSILTEPIAPTIAHNNAAIRQ